MKRRRPTPLLAFVAAALTVVLALACGSVSADEINDQTYFFLENSKPCVRLLHKSGSIGCATPRNGWQGTLRLALTQSDLNALIASAPSERVAVVITTPMMTRTNLNAIRDGLTVAGVMVTAGSPPAGGFSSAPPAPDCNVTANALSPGYPYCTSSSAPFAWNSFGDGAAMEQYQFAIVAMSQDESDFVIAYATTNEQSVRDGAYAAYAGEFNYQMFGTDSSIDCLNNAQCMPVGGYSVWSTYGNFNASLPWVIGTATMDSSAFFHDGAVGADSAMSGFVTMFAAQQALANAPGVATVGDGGLPRQIVFGLFTGESWSHVGSRRFVADLTSFSCDTPDGNGGCAIPFKPSLAFTALSLPNLYRALDMTQVGLNSTLAMHTMRNVKPAPAAAAQAAFLADIATAAGTVPGMGVTGADPSTPGLPPSPLLAFVEELPDLPAVSLADHTGVFTNTYYRSDFDTATNLRGGSIASAEAQLCSTTTLAARILYLSAGGTLANATTINADCGLVSKLYDCMVTNPNCAYVSQYLTGGLAASALGVPTHYSSVYQLMMRQYLGGISAFTALALADVGVNASLNTFTHDAVDPALSFDYNAGMYVVGNTSQTYLWAESNWRASIWTRVFRRESPTVELALIISGFALVVVSVIATYSLRQCCTRHFKTV